MGKKRIITIDLSTEEEKKPKHSGSGRIGSSKVKGKKIVKSGKQHGRIVDMGMVMLEEMKRRKKKEEEKHLKGGVAPAAHLRGEIKKKKALKKVARPKKTRSARYQALRKLIKAERFYPLAEAIELLKKTANAQFDESVELHLVTNEPGTLAKDIKTEKKFPLSHLKIGKTSETKEKLEEKIQDLLKAIGPNKIKKIVLTSTMSPGIKIDTSLLDRQ